jgi:metal-sulfur cluster biosynthetic enzyme
MTSSPAATAAATIDEITEALRDVIDPDLGVNVVDMGFVRAVELHDGVARLTMTLTSPACPLTGVMEDQIRTALVGPVVRDFTVDWVWKPAWSPALVTPEGREQLQAIGFTF